MRSHSILPWKAMARRVSICRPCFVAFPGTPGKHRLGPTYPRRSDRHVGGSRPKHPRLTLTGHYDRRGPTGDRPGRSSPRCLRPTGRTDRGTRPLCRTRHRVGRPREEAVDLETRWTAPGRDRRFHEGPPCAQPCGRRLQPRPGRPTARLQNKAAPRNSIGWTKVPAARTAALPGHPGPGPVHGPPRHADAEAKMSASSSAVLTMSHPVMMGRVGTTSSGWKIAASMRP